MSKGRSPSSVDGRSISSEKRRRIKKEIFTRYNNKCVECNSVDNLTLDHIVEAYKGGRFTVDNLQLLCYKCNQRKANPNYCMGRKYRVRVN